MMRSSFFLLFLLFLNIQCFAAPIYPKLTGQIVDRAQILSLEQKNTLLKRLKVLEEKSSDQLIIVTLPSLQGYDIAEFALELGRHWKIGQKDINNGVLLLIAPKERKIRIEVGYGLEGTLTDILAHKIITNQIKPAFKKGQMFEGIQAGTKDIIDILLGNSDAVKQRLKSKKPQLDNNNYALLVILFWGLTFFFPFLSSLFTGRMSSKRGGGVHIIAAGQIIPLIGIQGAGLAVAVILAVEVEAALAVAAEVLAAVDHLAAGNHKQKPIPSKKTFQKHMSA